MINKWLEWSCDESEIETNKSDNPNSYFSD